jgi:Fe-S cluster biogenesis protein NfuA
MSHDPNEARIVDRLRKLESLLPEIEQLPDEGVREKVGELMQTVLEFHGEALARLVDRLERSEPGGRALVEELGRDELIASLLILHGLHPLDLRTRVLSALEKVQPMLGSHGGSVSLLNVTPEGEVFLRLDGSCHGCPSSRVTLESSIEAAIYAAAPEVAAIHVEGVVEETPADVTGGFVPLSQLVGSGAAIQSSRPA